MTGRELVERAIAEMQTSGGADWALPCTFDLPSICGLIAALQLALRHPGATGFAAKAARQFIDNTIARVEQDGLLDVAALLRVGDDPRYDSIGERS